MSVRVFYFYFIEIERRERQVVGGVEWFCRVKREGERKENGMRGYTEIGQVFSPRSTRLSCFI